MIEQFLLEGVATICGGLASVYCFVHFQDESKYDCQDCARCLKANPGLLADSQRESADGPRYKL